MSVHLKKVLKHAEKKLQRKAKVRPEDQLELYRNFLKIEEHRILLAHRAGGDGLDVARQRSDLYTVVLNHIFEAALNDAETSHAVTREQMPITMTAVGGYGRGGLCPYSDIDLFFLFGNAKPRTAKSLFAHDVVEKVLYLLWDIGLKVGHASRSLNEALAQGKEDYQTFTAFLDIRLMSGNKALLEEFEVKFQKTCIKPHRDKYLDWRLNDQKDRHVKHSHTVFVQEPHVKNGCGGLRDYQNMLWVAQVGEDLHSMTDIQKAGWIKAPERKRLIQAHEFITRVRNQLHYDADRAAEVLTLRAQGEVATGLGYKQKSILHRTEALMKDYYGHSQEVFHTGNLLARRMAGEGNVKTGFMQALVPKAMRKVTKVQEFTVKGGYITVPDGYFFSKDLIRLVRAFRVMQQYDLELHPDTESRIRKRSRMLTRQVLRSNPEFKELLFHILSQKGKVGRVVRSMHRNEVLGRLIPEFAPLTCLVQHEFYHRYTADEHTIVCLEQLDMVLDKDEAPYKSYRWLFEECKEPELLYLALILHDVGKANNTQNHASSSVQKAVTFARRMGIKGKRLNDLTFLVDHHGSLNEFACRRNLEDPQTIRDFARIVQDQERLKMLMLMSFADTQGTGDQSWSNWKEGLVWNLYRLTDSMLSGEAEFKREREKEQAAVRKKVLQRLKPVMSEAEAKAHLNALPESYLNYYYEDLMIQQLTVAHRFVERQVSGEVKAEKQELPEIHWENRPNVDCSEVSLAAWDRPELFSKICGALTLTGLMIMSADIWTRKDKIVIDTFRVCTDKLTAAAHVRDKSKFIELLNRGLTDPKFNFLDEVIQHGIERKAKGVDEDVVEPALGIDNESSEKHTVLHVRATDRIGLLYIISECIARCGYRIVNARVSTEKGVAMDAFYLKNKQGGKITDRKEQVVLLKKLNKVITGYIS
ncbi:MAG: [protein-PII] uridylyltransferase [Verrucomicrobiota bacterium]